MCPWPKTELYRLSSPPSAQDLLPDLLSKHLHSSLFQILWRRSGVSQDYVSRLRARKHSLSELNISAGRSHVASERCVCPKRVID